MKKFLILLLSFLLFSFPICASEIVGEIVKEVVYDVVGEVIGYKYILETGEIWYQFYDEQIDQVVDASNKLLEAGQKLESYVVDAMYEGTSYRYNLDKAFPNSDEPTGLYFVIYNNLDSSTPDKYLYQGISNFNIIYNSNSDEYKWSFKYDSYTYSSWHDGHKIHTSGSGVVSNGSMYKSYIDDGIMSFYYNYYTNGFPDSNLPDGGWLKEGYTGYGDPEKGIKPEYDPFNPDSPEFNPQLVEDIKNGIGQLNLRIKIDSNDIVKAIQESSFNAEDWFEYLLKNSIWQEEEEESELNDFINQAMINLGVIPKSNTQIARVVTFSETEVEVDVEEDDGLYSDTSILVYPISIIKQFFDAIDDVEIDGTMNFPSIDVRGDILLEEQEFNFYQMIYDLGLSDLHEMYYLVINAGFTLGLVYYAKKKFAEFQEGKKGDAT